ncbi:MAG: hypothetical protein U9P11_10390, partial [Pseudomonadota bacterium]|nr:hypothetical protein [Pseudomonadota bacterium]
MLLEVLDEALLHSVREALSEDIGSGDVTASLVPADQIATATVVSREPAVLCGMAWFNAVFAELDTAITVTWDTRDGDEIRPDQRLCTLRGPAAPLLTGERTALNFLQTLSGTATRARQYANSVDGLPVRILDTRKTIPGLRFEPITGQILVIFIYTAPIQAQFHHGAHVTIRNDDGSANKGL